MKKKITLVATSVLLVAAMVIGGTLAYFTDQTETATNTMTLGKVDIVQNEKDRYGNDFDQGQPLMPMVDKRTEKTDDTVLDEYGYFNSAMENVVDKIITVTNEAATGAKNQDAYVRTLIAFETDRHYTPGSNTAYTDMHKTYIGICHNGVKYLDRYFEIDGVEYILAVRVYNDALAPQNTTEPSLKQIFLAPTANNEAMDIFGNEYTILALSQGVQTSGFEGANAAADALDAAFGSLTDSNAENYVSDETLIQWFSDVTP